MAHRKLQIQHLNDRMKKFSTLAQVAIPPNGWIKAIRTALGMSLQQMGNKLSITRQSAQDIERREKDGSITLKALKESAAAIDMQLVYGFVPKDGTLEKLIENKAKEVATKIVMRTSSTMKLEDQENSRQRIEKAIKERTTEIVNEMPKFLWD